MNKIVKYTDKNGIKCFKNGDYGISRVCNSNDAFDILTRCSDNFWIWFKSSIDIYLQNKLSAKNILYGFNEKYRQYDRKGIHEAMSKWLNEPYKGPLSGYESIAQWCGLIVFDNGKTYFTNRSQRILKKYMANPCNYFSEFRDKKLKNDIDT